MSELTLLYTNQSPQALMKILDEELLPAALPFMLRPEDHFHGLEHSRETALLACFLAMKENVSPLAPMMAACLHDAGRRDNDEGMEHAHDGAEIAEMFFRYSLSGSFFTSEMQTEIIVAIYHHADPAQATNQVGAYLQDADRLRLAWLYGARMDLFSTQSGLRLAQVGRRQTRRELAICFDTDKGI